MTADARRDYEEQFVQLLARAMERRAHPVMALDAACGHGLATRMLFPLLAPGSRIVAISSDRARLKQVHGQLSSEGRRSIFVRKEAGDRLPYASGVFDVVWAALYDVRLRPLKPTLRELLRVLRPGGQLLIAALLRESIMEMLRALGESLMKHEDSLQTRPLVVDNATVMDAQEWRTTLGRCGAVEVELTTHSFAVSLPVPPSSSQVFCECLLPMWLGEEHHTRRDALRVLDAVVKQPVELPLTIGCLSARRGMAEILPEEASSPKPAVAG